MKQCYICDTSKDLAGQYCSPVKVTQFLYNTFSILPNPRHFLLTRYVLPLGQHSAGRSSRCEAPRCSAIVQQANPVSAVVEPASHYTPGVQQHFLG